MNHLVIVGPQGSGKTSLALKFARENKPIDISFFEIGSSLPIESYTGTLIIDNCPNMGFIKEIRELFVDQNPDVYLIFCIQSDASYSE